MIWTRAMLTPLKALRSTSLTSTQRLTQMVAQMQIRCVPMALHQPDQLCCIQTMTCARPRLPSVRMSVCGLGLLASVAVRSPLVSDFCRLMSWTCSTQLSRQRLQLASLRLRVHLKVAATRPQTKPCC